jgi:hypothetical protein
MVLIKIIIFFLLEIMEAFNKSNPKPISMDPTNASGVIFQEKK